jgi:flagellar M-ring protein FliF
VASLDIAAILPQSVWERIAPVWNSKWRTALLAGAGLLIALAIVALLWSWNSPYSVLFAGLSGKEGGRAIAELQKLNIPYRIAEGGRVILVPTADAGRARLELALHGVPKHNGGQWALLDNERLGVSPFVEQVDYVRALETALARTIGQVDGVVSAKVHLAVPKQTDFLASSPEPSASVMLRLQPGLQLTAAQVDGIAGLVAASVPGLARHRVTIIDQSGRVLNPSSQNGLEQVSQQLAITRDVEQRYKDAVSALLAPVLGAGNFRVAVDADLDFSKSKESSITYGNGHVLSQDQTIRPQLLNQPPIGIPGALSNRPPATPITTVQRRAGRRTRASVPKPAQKPTPPPLDRHQVTNYDVDRTVQYVDHPLWTLRALHTTVLVNDPTGKPMPAARLQAIDTLVRSVIGVGDNRHVAVVGLPFRQTGAATANSVAVSFWWNQPWAVAAEHNTVLALAGLLVLFGGVFPALRRLHASAAAPAAARLDADGLPATPPPLSGAARRPILTSPGLSSGSQGGFSIDAETVRTLATNDPARAAQVIKEWIARDRNRLR